MKLIPKFQEGSVLEDPNTKEIANYIISYIQSPVFSKRLQTTYNIPTAKEWGMRERFYDYVLDLYNKNNFINYNNVSPNFNLKPPKIKYNDNQNENPHYNSNTHTVNLKSPNYYNTIARTVNDKSFKNMFDFVGAHEIAHSFDIPSKMHIEDDGFPFTVRYSTTIPAFRLMNRDFSITLRNTDKYGSLRLPYEENHDNFPSEKYADFMAARYAAYKHGIFDSREDKPITLDQVKQLKALPEAQHYLEKFTDEELLWLLNNVADNSKYKNSKKDNLISEDIVQKYLT